MTRRQSSAAKQLAEAALAFSTTLALDAEIKAEIQATNEAAKSAGRTAGNSHKRLQAAFQELTDAALEYASVSKKTLAT